jgi:hypothetical protein
MAVNPRNAAFMSNLGVDQILGTYTGSFVVPAAGSGPGSITATDSKTTNITSPTFFQGIYSIDGGTTWNDFCNQQMVLPPGIFFPFLVVTGKSIANTMTIKAINYYNYNTSSSSAYTVMYKVALLAMPGQGVVNPQPIGTATFFDSRSNYQKILLTDAAPISLAAGGTGTVTVTHNLGYVPKIRPFMYLSSDSSINELVNSGLGTHEITVDTSNVVYTLNAPLVGGLAGTLYTRIYFDN